MRRSIIAVVTVAVLASLWLTSRQTIAQQVAPPAAWEYACIVRPIDQFTAETHTSFLNEQGAQGWELADHVPLGQSRLCVFRRPRQ